MRKAWLTLSIALAFVCVADGVAMMLPGASGGLRGGAIALAGLAWLFGAVPRFMSREGRAFGPLLVTRMGLVLLPLLVGPVALLWWVATPEALNGWFAVAWALTFASCLAATALWPCPACGRGFGRAGGRLALRSSRCAHCGVDARAGEAARVDTETSA